MLSESQETERCLVSDLPALVLLVAAVVGMAGELAGVAAAQPRVTGLGAAAFWELLPDVCVGDNSLERHFIKKLRKKIKRTLIYRFIYLFILWMIASRLENKSCVYHLLLPQVLHNFPPEWGFLCQLNKVPDSDESVSSP